MWERDENLSIFFCNHFFLLVYLDKCKSDLLVFCYQATGEIYWRTIFLGEWKKMMHDKTLLVILSTYYIYWTHLQYFEKKSSFFCYQLYRKGKTQVTKIFEILKCYRISNFKSGDNIIKLDLSPWVIPTLILHLHHNQHRSPPKTKSHPHSSLEAYHFIPIIIFAKNSPHGSLFYPTDMGSDIWPPSVIPRSLFKRRLSHNILGIFTLPPPPAHLS